MKTIIQWSALALYLGVGIILGGTIMLARDFDLSMAIGGIIAIISVGIYTFAMWKTGQLLNKNNESQDETTK